MMMMVIIIIIKIIIIIIIIIITIIIIIKVIIIKITTIIITDRHLKLTRSSYSRRPLFRTRKGLEILFEIENVRNNRSFKNLTEIR